jgi:hypothetical protein
MNTKTSFSLFSTALLAGALLVPSTVQAATKNVGTLTTTTLSVTVDGNLSPPVSPRALSLTQTP